MKGRAPTAAQRRFHDLLCRHVGCIACRLDGIFTDYVSIHHIDGRTKPAAHWLVLPLCAGHHQDGTGRPGLIAVHPWRARFVARYGAELQLLGRCIEILQGAGLAVPAEALTALGTERREAA